MLTMLLMKDIKLGGSIRLMPKPSSPAKDHLLVARHVTKSFGTFVANDDVNLLLVPESCTPFCVKMAQVSQTL